MKKKDIIITLLLIISLLIITIGISIAFFNYTRTGNENVLVVGRIYFNSSQGTSINLTNVFPVKSGELENNDNVSSVTLTIRGDTTYNEGLEYLVSADQVNNTVNGKKVPIGTSVTVNNLGTNDEEYFTNRGGNSSLYKVLSKGNIKEDGKLVVGYITKGATGVNGTVTVSAWINGDKLAISDTYDRTESDSMGTTKDWVNERIVLTTEEWNSLQSSGISFKLKVEANESIWVSEPFAILGTIAKEVNTVTQINFANASSSTNGEGVYILPGTENDSHPIYYYRGAVDNNNVVFAGFCWQMVRTTDTGGIKMIYNGEPEVTGSGTNTTYNCGSDRPKGHIGSVKSTTDLNQSTGYFYADDYEIVSASGTITYRLKSKTNPITQVAITSSNASSIIPTIVMSYPYTCKEMTADATCTILYKVDSYASGTNVNVYSSVNIEVIGNSVYYPDYRSISDVGYMYNKRYPHSSSDWVANALFGSDVTWNGTNYVLTDVSSTAPDTTHHYSCNATTADAMCTSVRYVYYIEGSETKFYITLSGGELIEDALYKMTGNGDVNVKARNSSYNLNVTNSKVKEEIDSWFRYNLTNEINTDNLDYSAYLEDTIYCDDRSYKATGSNIFTQSGWNPDGGLLRNYLYFGTWDRFSNSWYSETNVPSIICPNAIDRFTVSRSNGNGALTYPVALLTADEIIMAGASGNGGSNTNYYLYTGFNYWALTTSFYGYGTVARGFLVYNNGDLYSHGVDNAYGLRPVVSLKPGTEFLIGGNGTVTNPYVVNYN